MTEPSPIASAVRFFRQTSFWALLLLVLASGACADDTVEKLGGGPARFVEPLQHRHIDKLDLLLVVDNSTSMDAKQALLAEAIPDLLEPLIEPPCLDPSGEPAAEQPVEGEDCLGQSLRAYPPLRDIHIGVVSSSLGGHGADVCLGDVVPSEDDHGHLIARSGTEPNAEPVATWDDSGFLVWDPATDAPTHAPPGLSQQDELIERTRTMVTGAGSVGCGYEAPLEAWYRFLIDPDPHQSITLEGVSAVTVGTDTALLEQRRRFLRPDSVLMVVMLSDENDCSIRDGSQFYYALRQQMPDPQMPGEQMPYHLPKPRAACAVDPADPCCRSCGQSPAEGCDTSMDDCESVLEPLDDHHALRCFDQKRRFGIDFAYPIERYIDGLTKPSVSDRHGNIQPNPLYDVLDVALLGAQVRSPDMVFIAGIVGVPWQDLARTNDMGAPDLLAGNNQQGEPVGGFQSAHEMTLLGTWPLVAGFPSVHQPPTDPFMNESVDPRQGQNPKTGEVIQPPGAGEGASVVNGHERSIPLRDDLQYACIFPLATPRDCSDPAAASCECGDPANDNPLCVPNPADGGQRTLQRYDKAYPGIRPLTLLRDMGEQAIVGSICPAQRTDPSAADYAYKPSMAAILETITGLLSSAHAGICIPRTLSDDAENRCSIIEARRGDICDCARAGRQAIDEQDERDMVAAIQSVVEPTAGYNCFCEIIPLSGEARDACRTDPDDPPQTPAGDPVHGWCYIDAANGDPALLNGCPADEQQRIRLAGEAKPQGDDLLFIQCR